MVSQLLASFGVYGSSASGDMCLISHVISHKGHVNSFLEASSLRYVTILISFMAIGIVIVEIRFSFVI